MRECRETSVEGAGAEDAGHHPIYINGGRVRGVSGREADMNKWFVSFYIHMYVLTFYHHFQVWSVRQSLLTHFNNHITD